MSDASEQFRGSPGARAPRVLLGVCGSIAAYKAVEVCRRLVDSGAHVVPVMTADAERFVGATTLSALASERVRTSLWSDAEPVPHIALARSVDVVLVAPATARLLGAYAAGIADDLLLNVLLATTAPVVVCPAMHTEMWEHPATRDNVARLRERGVHVVEPDHGRLAGGDEGAGRLPDPDRILDAVAAAVRVRTPTAPHQSTRGRARRPDDRAADQPDRLPGHMPDAQADRLPGHVPDAGADRLPGHVPDAQPDRLPGHEPADQPDRLPGHMPDARADRLPGHMPDARGDGLPGHVPDAGADRLPDHEPADQPDRLPDHEPDAWADSLPGHMPDARADRLPGHMPDAWADSLPGHMPDARADRLPDHEPADQPDRLPAHVPDARADGPPGHADGLGDGLPASPYDTGSGGGNDLAGRRILVTAGGTREPVDAVRFLGNRSSGRQGEAVAAEAAARGASVVLVTAAGDRPDPPGVEVVRVETAAEMEAEVMARATSADAVVMAAAVADFRPKAVADGKLRKDEGVPDLVLEPTTDILAALGRAKPPGQVLVGFAAETGGDVRGRATQKLRAKRLDAIVANDVTVPGAGFGHDTNAAVIIEDDGAEVDVPLTSKREVAARILDVVARRLAE